jgi:hypothetical protein
MISSTVVDLPGYRSQAMDACLRQGMFPEMMEHLPASNSDAIQASVEMVDRSDIYLGIVGTRYGSVPMGHSFSLTEIEYDRAVEREIPRLIFLMDECAATEGGNDELTRLRERLKTEHVVNFFHSPDQLKALIINSLSQYRRPNLAAFHYVVEIPTPPEPYIAHRYVLQQSTRLVGRESEQKLLTGWVAKTDPQNYEARVFSIVAVGGMGKSALAWNWFNDAAPKAMKPLAGRLWWSFYESDATFENFVSRALAYVSSRPWDQIEKIPSSDREEQLLTILNRNPFLLHLDGLERIMVAYARMDALRLPDDVQNDNDSRLRKMADPRVGRFLRKLKAVENSRIVISSRLFPADLETLAGTPMPGCPQLLLEGLGDDEAVDLWHALGVKGSRDALVPVFKSFGKHPLVIQALAGEISHYRKGPGDFERWRKDNPGYNPMHLPGVQNAMASTMQYVFQGLDDSAREVLHTIAGFRLPVVWDTLAALLIGRDARFINEGELDIALTELQDRGLLGWDKRANRYDLHPIVRGVAWDQLGEDGRRGIYETLENHFRSLPSVGRAQAKSFDELTPGIELYNALVGLARYDDAERVFEGYLKQAMLYRLSANRQMAEMLEMLFPDGPEAAPRINPRRQPWILNSLGQSYHLSDRPGKASDMYRRANALFEKHDDSSGLSKCLCDLAGALRISGRLHDSEAAARTAFLNASERGDHYRMMISLGYLGLVLAVRGIAFESEAALNEALTIAREEEYARVEGAANADIAQRELWFGNPEQSRKFADRAWELASARNFKRDFVRAARLQGTAALKLGDISTAEERLHEAVILGREVSFAEGELSALTALAELRLRQRDVKASRELLEDVWGVARRGPYPIVLSDALNLLAQIERESGNGHAAASAASLAYRLAWCDGPPFAYFWGLEEARKQLTALGAPEPPDVMDYEESMHDRMPKKLINLPLDLGK